MKKSLFLAATLLCSQAAFAQLFVGEEGDLQKDEVESFAEESAIMADFPVPPRDHRTPKGDLIVKAINIQQTISDDVSNHPVQMVTITVQNIGNRAVQASNDEIQMNGPHYQASVYGPNGIPNSYNLGAPIGPGQLGLMSFYLPAGTLRHCQKVSGVIDTRHTMQFGPYEQVFYNDSLGNVFVVDKSSIRACINDPIIIR